MASRSWNRVELIGNLTRDPELRYTPNGAAVCTFGLATNRTFVSDGEKKEEVDFHRLVAWNKLAELCNQLLKKGMKVFISGRLQTRSWEAADGQTRQITEIVVEDMIILSPKSSGPSEPQPGAGQSLVEESSSSVGELHTRQVEDAFKQESKPKVEEQPEISEKKEKEESKPSKDEEVDDLPF